MGFQQVAEFTFKKCILKPSAGGLQPQVQPRLCTHVPFLASQQSSPRLSALIELTCKPSLSVHTPALDTCISLASIFCKMRDGLSCSPRKLASFQVPSDSAHSNSQSSEDSEVFGLWQGLQLPYEKFRALTDQYIKPYQTISNHIEKCWKHLCTAKSPDKALLSWLRKLCSHPLNYLLFET